MKFPVKDIDAELFIVKLYPCDNDLEYLRDILKYISYDRKDLKNYICKLIRKHEEYYDNREKYKKIFKPQIPDPIAWK